MNPTVSVCVPVHNSESFLRATIQSVLDQTLQDWELILVNDGSTDSSAEIINAFQDPRIVVLTQENRGASAARNAALNHAKGKFIQFLDADDILASDKLEKQVNILLENADCLVGCQWVRFFGTPDHQIGSVGPDESIRTHLSPGDWLLKRHTIITGCWLTPKTLIDKAGAWDESLTVNDDGEYFGRVILNAKKVLYCNDTIVFYRSGNPNRLSARHSAEKYRSIYDAAVSYKNVLKKLMPGSAEADIAIGNTFKELSYLSFPQHPEIVKLCNAHPEIRLASSEYNPGGSVAKLFVGLFGWKAVRFFKHYLQNTATDY